MSSKRFGAVPVAAALAAFVGANAFVGVGVADAKPSKTPTYSLVNVGAFGGEPSITANSTGELYDTTPSGGTVLYRSTTHGASWTQATTADTSSGDDCVVQDQSNALYLCNLAGSQSTGPLQADVWKSLDDGSSWIYGNNNVDQLGGSNLCGTSCNPFGVDRPWADAYIPPHGSTGTARVGADVPRLLRAKSDLGSTSRPTGARLSARRRTSSSDRPRRGADQGVVAQADRPATRPGGTGGSRRADPHSRPHLRRLDCFGPGKLGYRLQRHNGPVLP